MAHMRYLVWLLVWGSMAVGGAWLVRADEAVDAWSRWRGRDAAGQGGEGAFTVAWSADAWAWKVDLPGVGHASPIVWRDHVYTASADEAAGVRYLLCHDLATGKRLWSREIPGPIDRHHTQNSSASGSVAADPLGIYWLWGTRDNVRLEAVSHEGQPRWHVDLGPFAAEHGFGGTPTVCEDLVIVPLEQDGPGFVVGLDVVTGKERWRLPREGVDKAAYSTPLVIKSASTHAVICTSHGHGLYAVDPGTGRVLWEHRCFPRRTVSSPIQAAGLLIGTSGDGGGNNLLVAVKPPDVSSADASRAEATVAYSIDKSAAPYVPTPLESKGRLYLWGDRGVVTCVRVADGALVWKGRVGGNYSASPIVLGGRIINVASDGEIVVIADGDSFEVLGRTPLDEETRATPAVADSRLLFRSASHLWALPLDQPLTGNGADGN
jgi:outer membrane protein assembly factor BamB